MEQHGRRESEDDNMLKFMDKISSNSTFYAANNQRNRRSKKCFNIKPHCWIYVSNSMHITCAAGKLIHLE